MGLYCCIYLCVIFMSLIVGLVMFVGLGNVYVEDSVLSFLIDFKLLERMINVYVVYGDGCVIEGGDMYWCVYEVGFGDVLNDYLLVYFVYLNEGYLLDYYCDGFVVLGLFCWLVGSCVVFELLVGLYFSMDIMYVDNQVCNEKCWGVCVLVVVWYYFVFNCFFFKLQYNYVQMFSGFNFDVVLFGIGLDFGGDFGLVLLDGKMQVSVWVGMLQMNCF